MNVLVDTSIWAEVLRQSPSRNPQIVNEMIELINEQRVQIIGPIRQEILSGIKTESRFEELRRYFSAFPDIALETADFERAAGFFNRCRQAGIQGSNTDFLICAVASGRNLAVFTSDLDFSNFKGHIPVVLYAPRNRL